MPPITVIVPTFNEEQNLRKCLESVKGLADEIIVVDSYSTDGTREIALEYTPNVVQQEYRNSASQKNRTIPQATHEWILLLDADEWVTPELYREISAYKQKEPKHTAYRIYRKNYFLGKRIRYSGWQGDNVIRFFKRDACRYEEKFVHAEMLVDGTTGPLKGRLGHNTYKSLDHFIEKINRYSSWSAQDYNSKTGMLTPWHFVIKPGFRFVKHFIIRGGFLDGSRGFFISCFMAYSVYMRYLKMWEMRKGLKKTK